MGAGRSVWVSAVLLLLVASAFGAAIDNGWLYDDYHLIAENPAVRETAWWDIWTTARSGSADPSGWNFRPFTMSSYVIDQAVGGGRVAVFHATQLGLHAVFVLLVYATGLCLWRRWVPAAIAALLAALHPVQVEAVHYLSARSSVLAAIGMVVALWAHAAKDRIERPGVRWLGLIGAAIAGLSKESGVMVLGWIMAYDALVRRAPARRIVAELAPYIGVFVAVGLWRAAAGRIGVEMGASIPVGSAVATGVVVVARHFGAWVWPPVANVAPQAWVDGAFVGLIALAVLAAAVAVVIRLRRAAPVASFGLACALWSLLPVMALPFLTNVALFQYHRGYAAAAGLAIATTEAARRAWGAVRRRMGDPSWVRWLGVAVMSVLVVAASLIDVVAGRAWRDEGRFWSRAVERYPHEAGYWQSLAAARLRSGDAPGSLRAQTQALSIEPTLPRAAYNLGIVYAKLGRYDEAISAYERAVAVDPFDAKALANLGSLHERRGDVERALESYRRALAAAPHLAKVAARIAILEQMTRPRPAGSSGPTDP